MYPLKMIFFDQQKILKYFLYIWLINQWICIIFLLYIINKKQQFLWERDKEDNSKRIKK